MDDDELDAVALVAVFGDAVLLDAATLEETLDVALEVALAAALDELGDAVLDAADDDEDATDAVDEEDEDAFTEEDEDDVEEEDDVLALIATGPKNSVAPEFSTLCNL